ncbi:MAG: hypothetical protein ACRDI3_08260 [Actinomycetota bacterium]
MRKVLAAVVCLALLVLESGASAHDHEPPRTKLRTGDSRQGGILGSYCWTAPDGDGGFTGTCVDAIPTWPDADPGSTGARARIRFFSRHRPSEIDLSWYERVDRNGFPVGDTHQIDPRLVAVRNDRDRVIAYDARFRLRATPGHMYINAFGRWEDRNGAGGMQDASWTFHLRVR